MSFRFASLLGVDIVLGPEMRRYSAKLWGSVPNFQLRLPKANLVQVLCFPIQGEFLLASPRDTRDTAAKLAKRLYEMGYELLATDGTAMRLAEEGVPGGASKKRLSKAIPNLIDHMKNNAVDLILNTPNGKGARTDEGRIRATAVQHGIPCITTIQASEAVVGALEALRTEEMEVQSLQDRLAGRHQSKFAAVDSTRFVNQTQ